MLRNLRERMTGHWSFTGGKNESARWIEMWGWEDSKKSSWEPNRKAFKNKTKVRGQQLGDKLLELREGHHGKPSR